jgi:hypothetical protein
MPTLRIVLAIAILGALPAVCSERQPVQCDAQCEKGVKNRTRSYKIFMGATDEEWQTAFAGADGELAQGDWSQRLSEIQQEYCRTPGRVDYLSAQRSCCNIDIALTIPSGAPSRQRGLGRTLTIGLRLVFCYQSAVAMRIGSQ